MVKRIIEVKPTKSEFVRLAGKHNLIVLSHKFYADWLTPLGIYYTLNKAYKGDSFLLESISGDEKVCRFSFIGCEPVLTFKSKGKRIFVSSGKARTFESEKGPLVELKKVMRSFKVAPKEHIRFFGGFVGYAGYDVVRFYEPIGEDLDDIASTLEDIDADLG